MTLTYESTSRTIALSTGDVHYHEAGDGAPLVLLHGSGPGVSAWANFGENLQIFSQDFRTFALDFPGFGVSHSAENGPLAAALPAAIEFIEALGVGPVAIVGNSMGGNIGAKVAAARPDLVRRLVTMGGVGVSLFSPSPPEGVKLLTQFIEQPSRERLVAWMESMVFDPALLTDEFVDVRWNAASQPGALDDVARMYNSKILAAMRRAPLGAPDQAAVLTKIKCPTLVTWGRDDRVTPLDGLLLPMRLIRNCEAHVFADCGHWAMIERKAEFERVVIEFLTRDL